MTRILFDLLTFCVCVNCLMIVLYVVFCFRCVGFLFGVFCATERGRWRSSGRSVRTEDHFQKFPQLVSGHCGIILVPWVLQNSFLCLHANVETPLGKYWGRSPKEYEFGFISYHI